MTITPEIFKSAFPNLDIATSLNNLGNNTELLQKVIKSFYTQYKDATITDITSFLSDNKIEDATRLAHTIKGLSGTIGATDLQKISLDLELACKENILNKINETLVIFSNQFEKSINEIHTGLQQLSSQE